MKLWENEKSVQQNVDLDPFLNDKLDKIQISFIIVDMVDWIDKIAIKNLQENFSFEEFILIIYVEYFN